MQNRLVVTGIPPSIPRLPNAKDSLVELVEEHACWVDRLAFIPGNDGIVSDANNGKSEIVDIGVASCAMGVELHNENVRDKAVKSLDGLFVSMDQRGKIVHGPPMHYKVGNSEVVDNEERKDKYISFRIRARPANSVQAAQLVRKCPIQSDDVEAEKRMEEQTLQLSLPGTGVDDNVVAINVRRSREHGGTGTFPWRGGLILAKQFCIWATGDDNCNSGGECERLDCIDFGALFRNRKVLELGAGAAGLPSIALGKICNSLGYEMELIASDGIDEIVNALRANISANELGDFIRVEHVDWNDYTNNNEGDGNESRTDKVDTILFSDCIYNEECAIALGQTISHLLKPGGNVIGVLPDFRVGLTLFQERMRKNGFTQTNIPILAMHEQSNGFACSGGGGKDYQLVLWR